MSTPNENDTNAVVATPPTSANGERRSKKPSSRPSMQIYRPPGLRSSDENQQAKPSSAAGTKQPKKDSNEPIEENNNEKIIPPERTDSASPLSNSSASSPNGNARGVLKRNDSNVSNSSQRSQSRASPPVMVAKNAVGSGGTTKNPHKKDQASMRHANPQKKKTFGAKEIEEIATGFKQLNFAKESANIDVFLNSNLENVDLAQSLAQTLVQFAIEESRINGKNVARLSAQVMDSPAGAAFHTGLVTSITQYFDCRSQLRVDHFRVWIAFLNFVPLLTTYTFGSCTYQGELVNVVFQIFDYMLKAPVLESLKIEELECLIGALLNVGYDLERHCPDQLGVLKDLIRNALIEVHEPWARKMILLLMELCASSWKLPADATDYYFQHTSS